MEKESGRRGGLAKLWLREGPEHRARGPDGATLTIEERQAGSHCAIRGQTAEYSAPHLCRQLSSARKVSFYIYSGCLPRKEAHIDASFGPCLVKSTPAKGKKITVSTENSFKGLSSSLPEKPQRPSRKDTWGCHLWNLPGSYTLIIVLLKTSIKHIWNAS